MVYLFIWNIRVDGDRDMQVTEREAFQSAGSLSKFLNSWGLARPKPGDRSSLYVSLRNHLLLSIICVRRKLGRKQGRTQPRHIANVMGVPRSSLTAMNMEHPSLLLDLVKVCSHIKLDYGPLCVTNPWSQTNYIWRQLQAKQFCFWKERFKASFLVSQNERFSLFPSHSVTLPFI